MSEYLLTPEEVKAAKDAAEWVCFYDSGGRRFIAFRHAGHH